tara:strand:- start:266 stop:457 length:192 start_codon:yes stop_codon:yes gene_type:complete
MFEKYQILIIIFIILIIFYLVISIGAGKIGKRKVSMEIKNYLFNVRILIIIIALFSIILWSFG